MSNLHTLSVLVEDKPGVLARVASLFARRGFNIHSLAVGPTAEEGRSRMTVVVEIAELEQVKKQLHKLVNVIKITEFKPQSSEEKETIMVRVAVPADKRVDVMELVGIFNATVVDVSPASLMFSWI